MKKNEEKNLGDNENCSIFALAIEEQTIFKILQGGLPEWLMEQFAKLSTRKGRKGSNPLPSAARKYTGCSVVRSSRLVWDQEVAGSNPAIPTLKKAFLNEKAFF